MKEMAMTESPPKKISYLEIQSLIGTTKHMGGFISTKELLAYCNIRPGDHILDVGCGVGATSCYLAKEMACTVIGVDLSERMVEQARERAVNEDLTKQVEFKTASVLALPFEDRQFDIDLCESVLTFVEDKGKAIAEFVRVTKPGGRIGLNEETWIASPPPTEVLDFIKRTWGITGAIPTRADWVDWMTKHGLEIIAAELKHMDAARESSQMKRYKPRDMVRMFSWIVRLSLTNPAFRQYMKDRPPMPRKIFDFLGYGLYVGKK